MVRLLVFDSYERIGATFEVAMRLLRKGGGNGEKMGRKWGDRGRVAQSRWGALGRAGGAVSVKCRCSVALLSLRVGVDLGLW